MTAKPMRAPCELVREFPFFAGLDAAMYGEILACGHLMRYAKGEPLFFEGEVSKGLFIVHTGAVKIYKLAENGREQILAIQRPGESVAELPLFDHGLYPASAAALEDSEVFVIPADPFMALLARNPQVSQAIIAALARRMRKLVELVGDLSLRQVRGRLARFLLEEARERHSFRLALTNEELAARVGSVRDVVSRTLNALQTDGLIRLHGREVTILDADGMAVEGE
jgi:CRP-like cAMP-binding protein